MITGADYRSPSPSRPGRFVRAGSEPYVPPPTYGPRSGSVAPRGPSVFDRATSLAPFTRPFLRASSLEPLDELFASKLDEAPAVEAPPRNVRAPSTFERAGSPAPTPIKEGRWGLAREVPFDADGKNLMNN